MDENDENDVPMEATTTTLPPLTNPTPSLNAVVFKVVPPSSVPSHTPPPPPQRRTMVSATTTTTKPTNTTPHILHMDHLIYPTPDSDGDKIHHHSRTAFPHPTKKPHSRRTSRMIRAPVSPVRHPTGTGSVLPPRPTPPRSSNNTEGAPIPTIIITTKTTTTTWWNQKSITFWVVLAFIMLLLLVGVVMGGYCGSGKCSRSGGGGGGDIVKSTNNTAADNAPGTPNRSPSRITTPSNPNRIPINPPPTHSATNVPTPRGTPIITMDPSSLSSMIPSATLPPVTILPTTTFDASIIRACQFFTDVTITVCSSMTSYTGASTVGTVQRRTIPTEIGILTQLTYLELQSVALVGTIPSELGLLTQLSYLSVCCNAFTGTIPATLGNLIQLTALNFCCNQLTGTIPSALGQLTKLDNLVLSTNALTGNIFPSTFENLEQLTWLNLNENPQLVGTVPTSLCSVTGIQIAIDCENDDITCFCCIQYPGCSPCAIL